MTSDVRNVLFLCPGNSARSLLAEAILNQMSRGRFQAYSAGSPPTGTVHPMTLETLRALHLPVAGLRSKSWNEFATPGAPTLDFVFSLHDKAAGEVCPVWSRHPLTGAWAVKDPANCGGLAHEQQEGFVEVAHTLRRRIELFLLLPLSSLDALSLRCPRPARVA